VSPLTTPKGYRAARGEWVWWNRRDCRVIVVFVGNDIIVWQSVGLENLSDPG